MEVSALIQGSHAIASPCGRYVASLGNAKVRICSSYAPERATDVNIRPMKDVAALKWNEDSSCIAIVSAQHVEVVTLDDASHRIRLDNGSGGLGRFAAADFVGSDHLLVTWEFGKAKLWSLIDGKGFDLSDVKSLRSGSAWQMRPTDGNPTTRALAMLSRPGQDDILNIYFPALQKQLSSSKLSTVDAQCLTWSPNGRWLAVLDTPTANPSVHIFTPDGHLFRTYPSSSDIEIHSLGVKSVVWSSNSQLLALTKYDGRIVLLNTRTFAPLAMIEHNTTIDQRSLPQEQQAPVWHEHVSASGDRSFTRTTQPVSPPLSRMKPSTEPGELGVAEARFSCDGSFLATRDERMLNTVWIWNMTTLAAYTVLIQHSNVRRLRWHPTRVDMLMLDCGEGIAYLYDTSSLDSPLPISVSMTGAPSLSWVWTDSSSKGVMLATTKSFFRAVYPEGIPEVEDAVLGANHVRTEMGDDFEEGGSEDSLFDVLSGRKPLPPKTEPSFTERIDFEIETEEEDLTLGMDDTFREQKTRKPAAIDPLDDSEIF